MTEPFDNSSRDLEEQLRFETLLADLSARFVNLPANAVDSEIEDAQRRVCECMGLDLSALWQWDPDNPKALVLTHYHRPPGGPPVPERMVASDHFPWSLREVMTGRRVVVASFDNAPEEASRDVEMWRHYGIKNNVTLPLSAGGGTPFGVISFHDMVTPREWSEPLLKRLELVAQVFANAIVRKRSEQALKENEARLNLAADSAGMGLWSLDLASGRYWVTDMTREIVGFGAKEDVTLERFLEVVYSEDRDLLRQTIHAVVESRKEGRVEYRIVRPDGSPRWMLSRGRVHGPPDKAPTHLMGVTIDITERREGEKALRESGARMAAALDVAELGSYELLNGVRVTFLDRRGREIIGLPEADEQAGRILEFWWEHIHPEDRPDVAEVRRLVEEAGRDQMTVDYRFLNPERGILHIHHLAHVIERNAAGRAVRTIGVLQDITERRQMELDAIQSRLELTRVSRVATMGELVASLAHELNQPLTAILANAQAGQRLLTSSRPDIGEIREILADIAADDQRAGEVINRVRSLLKKGTMERKHLDMNDVIREVLGLLRTNALLKGVSVALELSPSALPVLGDRVQLQQVLLNLILNAFDAMPSGSGGAREVVVRSRRSETDGVLVAVRDSGPGIPPANAGRLFEPFFTTKPEGMGMGLPICRSIVENHGGRIWAENNPDRGATFQFALPMAEGERGEGRGAREEGRGMRDGGAG